MIKPTYYNLSPEKKQRLYLAAKKEFTRVSFNEASINKIIKDAEISRGSFYTYFDDKSDLARSLLCEYFKTVTGQIERVLKEGNGDVFDMFTQLFDITLEYTQIRDDMELFHSLFNSMRTSTDFEGSIVFDQEAKQEHLSYIMGKIDRSRLNLTNDDELKDLLNLLLIVTKQSMAKAMSEQSTKEAARQSFLYKINILKNGALKP